MNRLRAVFFAFKLFTVSGAFIIGSPSTGSGLLHTSPPPEFENLAADRSLLVDVYFGGKKIDQAMVTVSPGLLTFQNPALVVQGISNLVSVPATVAALSIPMPTNDALVCRTADQENCGILQPREVGIIFDEESFRVNVFVHPSLLIATVDSSPVFLSTPELRPSAISVFGATVSGSSQGDRAYHVQNRFIGSLGKLRLQSDSSVASRSGLAFDNLTLQSDDTERRYVAGLFWAPGSELVGRRKMAGVGLQTQLDTRVDKTALQGIPLSVFLQQAARVEVMIDGRVFGSKIYPAGHQLIDATSLPNGSYDVEIRVIENGRPARSERRFFSKGGTMAPLGHPQFSAFAGLLQTSSSRSLDFDRGIAFFQLAAAYRLAPGFGVDGSLIGTQNKVLLEAGGVVSTPIADLRIAGLTSSQLDLGAVFRMTSHGGGPFAASVDVRAVKSHDGRPLLPMSNSKGTFSEDPTRGLGARGSYLQAVGIVDYRFRQAAVRLSGLYRRDGRQDATYNVAASLELPVVRRAPWDVRLQADIRKSEREVASFLGMRFLMSGGAMALSGRSGISRQSNGSGSGVRMIGETQATWQRQLSDSAYLSTDAGLGRDSEGSYARASGHLQTPLLNARADILQPFEGTSKATQFTATADAAILINEEIVKIGAREVSDAAAIVTVVGGQPGVDYDVLVDGVARGSVRSGHDLTLFLPPYYAYEIGLRSGASTFSSLNVPPQKATLYPGNVTRLKWHVKPVSILFGRAVDAAGLPLRDADVRGPHGIARTDEAGYFQIEVSAADSLEIHLAGGVICSLGVPRAQAQDGYIPGGDLKCS